MLSNKRQLIGILSVLLVAGFLITSLAGYYVSRSTLRSQLELSELPLTSDNIYSEIQRDLMRPVIISYLMANDTFLRDWILNGEKDIESVRKYLSEIKDKYDAFASFFVSERTRLYYFSGGVLKRVNPGDKRDAWYFRVSRMEPPYEINVDPDMANRDAMTIFINFKVLDYRGNFIGSTGIGLTVTAVKGLIESYQRKYGRTVYFVDKNGDVVLHGQAFAPKERNLSQLPGISSHARGILSGESSIFRYTHEGKTYHVNTRFIPEFQWHLIVEQNEDKSLSRIRNTLLINLSLFTLITGLVIFITNLTISAYQKKLETMATTDKLTGVYNRQVFDILFNQTLRELHREYVPVSMVILDLDHFKNINDTLGHLAGDEVLKHVVGVVRSSIRDSDLLFRWGGEEFIVILKKCGLDMAFDMAEKIRLRIASSPAGFGGRSITVTVSLGVAEYMKDESEDSLLRRVDEALYRAKQNGRNRVEMSVQPENAS